MKSGAADCHLVKSFGTTLTRRQAAVAIFSLLPNDALLCVLDGKEPPQMPSNASAQGG